MRPLLVFALGFAGRAGGLFAFDFTAADDPLQDLAAFGAQIVFEDKTVKAFDLWALTKLFS